MQLARTTPTNPVRSRRSMWTASVAATIALGALAAPAVVLEVPPTVRDVSQFNLGKNSLALEGFDPVTYFEAGGGKPRKGDAKVELVHDGVRYRFVDEANKAAFVKEPARFEPTYGGWCAYAMADKEKVEVDVESFVVRDGRLFLFYQGWFNDTRAKWSKDPAGYTTRADANWAELIAPPKPKR